MKNNTNFNLKTHQSQYHAFIIAMIIFMYILQFSREDCEGTLDIGFEL